MNSKPYSDLYLHKIGGWSAILSGLLFGILTFYLYVFLGALGFKPVMFDDHTLLHPWVAEHIRLYQLSWIFYFLTQLFLIPVPYVLAHYFQKGNGKLKALAKLSATFGTTAIAITVLCPIIFYAASPITAQAYVATDAAQSQELVLAMSALMTDIPKEIRLFSEVFLGIWLMLAGFLFRRSTRVQGVGWLTFVTGFWTVSIVSIKIFDPSNPLEDFLGIVLSVNYTVIGLHLLRSLHIQKSLNQPANSIDLR